MRISDWSSDVCSSDLGPPVSIFPIDYKYFWRPVERVRVLLRPAATTHDDLNWAWIWGYFSPVPRTVDTPICRSRCQSARERGPVSARNRGPTSRHPPERRPLWHRHLHRRRRRSASALYPPAVVSHLHTFAV